MADISEVGRGLDRVIERVSNLADKQAVRELPEVHQDLVALSHEVLHVAQDLRDLLMEVQRLASSRTEQ